MWLLHKKDLSPAVTIKENQVWQQQKDEAPTNRTSVVFVLSWRRCTIRTDGSWLDRRGRQNYWARLGNCHSCRSDVGDFLPSPTSLPLGPHGHPCSQQLDHYCRMKTGHEELSAGQCLGQGTASQRTYV